MRGDDGTISGDGWTFKAVPGWVIREGVRRGDYEVVKQQLLHADVCGGTTWLCRSQMLLNPSPWQTPDE